MGKNYDIETKLKTQKFTIWALGFVLLAAIAIVAIVIYQRESLKTQLEAEKQFRSQDEQTLREVKLQLSAVTTACQERK